MHVRRKPKRDTWRDELIMRSSSSSPRLEERRRSVIVAARVAVGETTMILSFVMTASGKRKEQKRINASTINGLISRSVTIALKILRILG